MAVSPTARRAGAQSPVHNTQLREEHSDPACCMIRCSPVRAGITDNTVLVRSVDGLLQHLRSGIPRHILIGLMQLQIHTRVLR